MATSGAARTRDLEALRIPRAPVDQGGRSRPRALLATAIAVAGGVAAAGGAVYSRTIGRPLGVETMVVTAALAGPAGVLLTGSGYIVTRHKYITIGTKVLGQIVEEPIEEGQRVKRGDLLARIDDRDYRAQWRQATADRDLAQANLRLDVARAARQRELYRSQIASKDELEAAEAAAEVAQAALKRSEAAVDYASFMVGQCVITSPIDAVVLKKYRELGDTINYGGPAQGGSGASDIAQLADTGDTRAEVDVREADIWKLGVGMPAFVVPTAYGDRRFEASLVKIYPEADRQKGTVKIEVELRDPDLQVIKPEMSVRVNFMAVRATAKEEPRLTVPRTALVAEGASTYVWTVKGGVVRRSAVVVGRALESGVEVTQGLRDGDVVVIAPPGGLGDGQRVLPERTGR